MTFTADRLRKAREQGYTDDEIWEYASRINPKVSKAKEEGYSLDEVSSFFSQKQKSAVQQPAQGPFQPPPEIGGLPSFEEMFKPKPPKEGFFRQAADVPVGLAKGAAQGVRMFTDILGADNPVSQGIRGVEDYLGNLMSAQAKEDQQEIERIMKDAEDKGVLDQVMAGIKAFSVAPVDLTVQALGTMAPVVVGGLAANTAKLVATGIRGGAAAARGLTTGQAVATQAGVGLGTGAGVVKGTIYDEVKNELISQGLSEEAAHQEAVKAQEYGGKNLDQILLGAGLGAAAATTGAEKIVRGILTKTGVDATKSRVVNALQTGITEAIPEAAQGAQEQLAANVALQREGMEVPTMRGVFSSGALEGIAGFGVGAPLGAIQKASVAEDAARKAEEADAPQTANAIRKEAQQTVAAEKAVVQEEQDIEDTEKEMVPIQEEYKVPAKEEFKTTFAKMSPESIAQTEQGFREELESEDADTRAFAQAGLDALAEFRAGVAPTPITVPPVEEVAPAVAAATQPAAPAAPVTPAAPEEPVAAPAEPITSADAQVINNLRSVAENTANREQISTLSAAGLVDIIKGQPVINEDGEALLAKAQAPLPRLTPEERVAEIQAAPPAPAAEAPAIVEQAKPAPAEQLPTDASVTIFNYDERVKPIEDQIDNKIDELVAGGMTFQEADNSPEVTALYEKRFAMDRGAINSYRDIVNRAFADQGVTENNLIATPAQSIMQEVYAAPKQGDEGLISVVADLGQKAFDDDAATIKKLAEGIFKYRAEAEGLSPEGILGPQSALTPEGKKARVDEARLAAEAIHNQIKNSLIERPATQALALPAPAPAPTIGEKPPTSPMIGAEPTQPAPAEVVAEPTRVVTPAPEPAAAPAVVPEREGAPAPIESFKTNIKNSGFKYITYSDFRKANKTEDWENEGGVTIDESYYPTAVVGDTSVAFTTNGLSLYKGRVEVSYEADVDASGNNIFTIERIVTPEGKRGAGSASKALSEVTSAADKAGLTLQLEPAAVKPLIKKGGKGLTNKQLVDWYKRNGFVQKFEGSDLILIRPPAASAPAVTTPPAPEAVTPAPEGIAVGNRIKLGKSPQTYVVEEVIPQTATERDLGEQYYSVKNERTGEMQVVEKNDVKPVKAKGARRMAATRASLWEAPAQEIPSAATSINAERLPETFKRVKFESGTINADIGGGRFDNATEALAERGVDNVIYDPFNRPREWNNAAASRISGGRADTATVNSVLNVIKEPENRERVIMQAADAVKQDGKAYFLIHEGDSSGNSRITKQKDGVAQSWQEHRKAETYIPEISKHFGKVERRGNLIIASEPKKMGLVSDIRQQREEVTPAQKDNRYTYEQILVAAKKFFGGKAPANLTIVNDSTDPDYRFKAGYNLETGQIILNQAYLSKEDNIADNIAHELGHFVYGDPEVQAAFKEFWNALSPEQQAQADDIIRRHYSEESQSVQMEENQVRAFGTLIAENRIAPKWERFVNAVKAVLNRLVGTKFRLTDRGAQAVLSSAIKRFQSGERIIREMDAGILSERRGVDDARFAELEARAKAGDKEAEAEAQRMVDEAAKKAGYDSPLVYHGSSDKPFNIFKTKRGKRGTREGGAFFTTAETLANYFALISQQEKYGGLTDKPGIVYRAYLKIENPVKIDLKFENVGTIEDKNINRIKAAKKYGFDGIIMENTIEPNHPDGVDQYVVFNPEQIKSADPFTYDDAGNLIPLSQRFQPTSPDIRRMAVEAEPTVEPAAEAPQKKPRPTTIQRLIEATTGVKRRRDLLTINEKTALKDQLKLGAKKRRLDAAQQKEFVKDLTAQLREEAIRGRVKAPQLRAIVNKAMQVRFDNDASILSFLNYANKVIDNANYDRDVSDAKKAIKSAKRLAKQKDVPAPAQGILKRFANINPSDIDNPGDFALVLNEYMKGYGPVTAEDYVVVPDVEMEAYLDDPEVGLLKQSEDAKAERDQMALINSLNAELGKEGLTEEEKNDILNMSEEDFSKMIQQRKADTQNEKRVARAEAIEKAINDIAANSQIALVNYQNPEMTADQKRILDLVKQVELDQLDVGSRKEYIRIANSILVNNGFFGSQKFASKVLGQLGAKAAAKDSKQTKRYNAMFKFLEGMIGERISKSINLSVQSIADTFRNIAGKDGAPKLLVQMGMGELAKGQAIANKMNAQISDAIRGVFEKIEKETGLKISERRGSFAMGVAGNLLQIDPSETEAQGIQRIRNLIEQDIAIKEKSPSREDRESAVFVKRALDEVYADSVEGILANLKAAHPAHYEALVFLKDEILPEYKPLLKEHDELFNNQTDNYENVNYLPIRYRGIDFEIKAPEDLIQRQFRDVTEPKQSPNTIKRKKLTTLPPGRVFDYNLTRNVINALSDQITAANTNPAWQQIISFLASPDAAEAVGGVENLDFIKQRLGGLARARARTYATTGAERIADAFANLTRRFGIGLALGGYGQFFKQFPSQTATTLANVKDAGLLAESTRDLLEGKAQGILSQFSIGERGEIAGGTKWINQMEGNFGKVRKFYEEGRWAEFSDAFERLNNMWLFALKKSDYLAAGAGWLAYYRKHLKDKGIEFTGWENETNLINQNDPSRMEAAVYAEQMIDMYQGSSDPTKMAELSQRGQNGYENLFKAIFMPFFSFVLQERSRILSDTRDIAFGDANQKAQGAAGMGGTIAGMLIFHTMRRFLLPAVAAGGASAIYALLGVDMDEPDEEKQQEEANKIWRRFSAEVFSNIVVGGFGSLAENRFVDAVNYSFYIIESQIENENVLDDKGEVMSFDKYQKERSPFYRYTGMGADSSFGMLDIMPGQISELRKRVEELTSEELAETLTPEERRVLYVAGFSELIYTMRLNDTDVARMIRQMNKDVIEQGKEREKAEKRLQNLYR